MKKVTKFVLLQIILSHNMIFSDAVNDSLKKKKQMFNFYFFNIHFGYRPMIFGRVFGFLRFCSRFVELMILGLPYGWFGSSKRKSLYIALTNTQILGGVQYHNHKSLISLSRMFSVLVQAVNSQISRGTFPIIKEEVNKLIFIGLSPESVVITNLACPLIGLLIVLKHQQRIASAGDCYH